MKYYNNLAKNAINAVFSLALGSMSAFAGEDGCLWFDARFDEFEDWHVDGIECALVQGDDSGSYCNDSKLFVEGGMVYLDLFSMRDAECYGITMTIRTRMQCEGYDELPEPPLKSEGYTAAVAPMENGNYFVLEYDAAGDTNRWIDSGIPAVSDREFEVVLRYAYTNWENVVTYSFDGQSTAPVKVFSSGVKRGEFVGCGTVSQITGYDAESVKMIPVELPEINGIVPHLWNNKTTAYADTFITVWFDMGTMFPSRESAQYYVDSEGHMWFADEGEEPYGVPVEAEVNGVPYASLVEALAVAGPHDWVTVMSDVQIAEDVEVNCGVFDLNGHYVDPLTGRERMIVNAASICSYRYDLYVRGVVDAITYLNVSMDLTWQYINFYWVVLCDPEVTLTTWFRVPCYYSYDENYEVVENQLEDGRYVYSLKRIVPEDTGMMVKTDPRAELLGCSSSAVESELSKFKIEGITMESGKWVVTVTGGKRHGDRYGNGYVCIRRVDACGKPTEDESACFFRAELVPDPPSD